MAAITPTMGTFVREIVFDALWLCAFVVNAGFAAREPSWLSFGAQTLLTIQGVMLFHDCLHASAFAERRFNLWVGRLVGALFFWPFTFLRDCHLQHHKNVGLVDGDPELLHATREDAARRPLGRFMAHLARSPLSLLYAPIMQAIELRAWLRKNPRRSLVVEGALAVVVWTVFDVWLAQWGPVWRGFVFGVFGPSVAALLLVHYALLPMHYGMLSRRIATASYARRVLLTSRSFDPGWLAAWLVGNQTFHIEHHLYPRMSRFDLARFARGERRTIDAIAHGEGLVPMRHRSYFDFYVFMRALPLFSSVRDATDLRPVPRADITLYAVVVTAAALGYFVHPAIVFAPIVFLSWRELWHVLPLADARWFLAIALVTSAAGEWFGTRFGLFGVHYTYSFGALPVPLCVPFLWFGLMLPCWTVAAAITRQPVARAFLGAVLMCAIDLLLDPTLVAQGFWTWERVPESWLLYGIPQANFAAWIIGTFAAYLFFSWRRVEPRRTAWAAVVFLALGVAHAWQPIPTRPLAWVFVAIAALRLLVGARIVSEVDSTVRRILRKWLIHSLARATGSAHGFWTQLSPRLSSRSLSPPSTRVPASNAP